MIYRKYIFRMFSFWSPIFSQQPFILKVPSCYEETTFSPTSFLKCRLVAVIFYFLCMSDLIYFELSLFSPVKKSLVYLECRPCLRGLSVQWVRCQPPECVCVCKGTITPLFSAGDAKFWQWWVKHAMSLVESLYSLKRWEVLWKWVQFISWPQWDPLSLTLKCVVVFYNCLYTILSSSMGPILQHTISYLPEVVNRWQYNMCTV